MVSGSLSLPAQGCFSPVPHGTRPLSVTRGVFSLGGWSPQLHARLLESGVTQELHYADHMVFAYRAITVSGAPFQGTSADFVYASVGPTTPRPQGARFGLYPVSLAATRGISVDFSSSRYLDVSVPRVCSACAVTATRARRVSPFGHLGINACVPLPRAYRSLPRPSSPPCAQASPTCFRSLDLQQSCQAEHARSTLRVIRYHWTNPTSVTLRSLRFFVRTLRITQVR